MQAYEARLSLTQRSSTNRQGSSWSRWRLAVAECSDWWLSALWRRHWPFIGGIPDYIDCAFNMFANTAPADICHHPAMAIPCGMSDGLPVSMMLTGKHFAEPTIYRAAFAFEQSGDWTEM
jgi:Amidase